MKKVMAIISILMIVAMMGSAFSGSDNQITFRGVEWYSTLAEVKDELGWADVDIMDDMILLSDIDENWDYSLSSGYNRIDDMGLFAYYYDAEVAGYKALTYMSFIYPIENGASVKDANKAQLYMATYSISEYADLNAVYSDLKAKLDSLYGAGTVNDNRVDWMDSVGDKVVLSMDGSYVGVSYAAAGHKERLQSMHNVRISEMKRAEADERAQKANDTSGL